VANGRRVWLCFTDRSHGDLRISADPAELGPRRAKLADGPWTWLQQVHGDSVVIVNRVGEGAGQPADAAVTRQVGPILAVHSADCATVALWSGDGVVGAAHAGWRGLRAGVLERTVDAMVALGAQKVAGLVGPCIHPGCYEFGSQDLADLVEHFGPAVAARTVDGRPALDLVAAVEAALGRCAVPLDRSFTRCTGCDPATFSHRARADRGRQALLVRVEDDLEGDDR
jgi:copper oxidase (laccase) domain-containing protein